MQDARSYAEIGDNFPDNFPGLWFRLFCELQEVFASRGLQDWPSPSVVSLIALVATVINICFMCSDITVNGKTCLATQSRDTQVSLSKHKANIGRLFEHDFPSLIRERYRCTFSNYLCWTLSQKVLWESNT